MTEPNYYHGNQPILKADSANNDEKENKALVEDEALEDNSESPKKSRRRLTPQERIEELKRKKDKLEADLKAKKKKLDEQIRLVESRDEKSDTRRKILIGAAVLAIVNNPDDERISQDGLLEIMNEFLSRDGDRKLFDLDPIEK